MEQYISKSALVEEIKRRIDRDNESAASYSSNSEHDYFYRVKEKVYKSLLSFIDTLEVKKEPVSKDLEEAARRIATRHSHITGDTYYANDAWFFKKGAQWQKKQMIDKACEWLKSYRQDTPDGIGYIAGIVDDKTIKEFKQAMEE